MSTIKAYHTRIVISEYDLGDNAIIENSLSTWDEIRYKLNPIGYNYNEETRELTIPRGFSINYISELFSRPVDIISEHDKPLPASFRLMVEPRNDLQRKSISFLIGKDAFAYTRKYSQQSLNLQTGDGKTYCVIAALTFLKMKSLIITPIENIKLQWYESLLKMTDIDERYILNIKGSGTIDKILNSKKTLAYKVFLVNHRTISTYAKKNGWEKITELFVKLGVGVKVYDEAHLEFYNMVQIDLHTNTKKTIYLTANFERSDYSENKVFEKCFRHIPKYGKETIDEKRKHIIYVPVFFNSKPSMEDHGYVFSRMGLSKPNYISYQLEKGYIYEVIEYLINFFKEKEGKILLLFSTILATEQVFQFIQELNLGKSVGIYNSTISIEEKTSVKEKDIIISTPKSMGTGVDIPGLRVVIMTEPYSSKITANQLAGRLREIPGKNTFYVELVDEGFSGVQKLYTKRLPVFKEKCLSMTKLKYDKKD